MALFDGPSVLSMFNRYAGRPTSGDEISDVNKYLRLTEAQLDVIAAIAAIYPYCLYRSAGPTTLTTSDNKVYTFGNAGSGEYAEAPLGYVRIFRNLSDYPDNALVEGVDYLNEGTQIRIPNNRTDASTLYWMGVPTPDDIDASTAPSIRPIPARILIVIKAVENFAREGSRNPQLADEMEHMWAKEFPKWMLAFKTQYSQGGVLAFDGVDRAILRGGNLI